MTYGRRIAIVVGALGVTLALFLFFNVYPYTRCYTVRETAHEVCSIHLKQGGREALLISTLKGHPDDSAHVYSIRVALDNPTQKMTTPRPENMGEECLAWAGRSLWVPGKLRKIFLDEYMSYHQDEY